MPTRIYKRKPCTEITKEKLRQANLGKKLSEATKEKIRQGNLGKKHTEESKQKMRKPKSEETKKKMKEAHLGKRLPEQTGEKSRNWKGDNIGYGGLHIWVGKHKGKASLHKCIDCKKQAREWSNVNHTYKRNLKDYKPRCRKCHEKYDRESNFKTNNKKRKEIIE